MAVPGFYVGASLCVLTPTSFNSESANHLSLVMSDGSTDSLQTAKAAEGGRGRRQEICPCNRSSELIAYRVMCETQDLYKNNRPK